MNEFPVVFFLGKSGSGKDTQVDLLVKNFGFRKISSGDVLRGIVGGEGGFAEGYEKEKIKEILDAGGFVPTITIASHWYPLLLDLARNIEMGKERAKGLVFSGSPRKIAEAWLLEDFFENWPLGGSGFRTVSLLLDISYEEGKNRLLSRGRHDDNDKAIKSRMNEFDKFVLPVVDFYEEKNKLLKINGEQSVEGVHKEIVGALDVK